MNALTDQPVAATDQPVTSLKVRADEALAGYMRAHGREPANLQHLNDAVAYVDACLEHVGDALRQRDKRIGILEARLAEMQKQQALSTPVASPNGDSSRTLDALCKRVDELEKRPILQYRGVWTSGTSYPAGSCVTWAGSSWIAKEPTSAKPGDGATSWQLAIKAGRDGKDLR